MMAFESGVQVCSFSDHTHSRGKECEYDVFLSFRGEDTRYGFTGYLYDALTRKGINAFIDGESLRRGDEISPTLMKAIEGSRICVIVFSQNYASSTWCLDELVKIIDSMKLRGQCILPVFYQVDPSTVRHQRDSYEKAMVQHEIKFRDNMERVTRWRSALYQAANFSGWQVKHEYEFQFVGRIVEEVSSRLNRPILHVTAYPVGLESRISQIIPLLGLESNNDVRMVGIYGMGGIGKSTIARAVYNLIAPQFDGACFLSEVRETSFERGGLVDLQEKLLFDILGGKNKMELGNVYEGIPVIRHRLSNKKVLLILDDVNKARQLEALAGMPDWFGYGSRILITTRDKHLLTAHKITSIYEVELLNRVEALELFSWHAFRKREPDSIYVNISKQVVHYAEHLPLALVVIGGAFIGRSLEEWEDALRKYQSVPEGDIIDKLKISYDDLDHFEQKIFLDIACFFQREDLKYVHTILEACGFGPTIGITKLIQRSLLTVEYGALWMHSMIEEMAKEIVRRESLSNVGKRSRLWYPEDVIQVLTENMGTNAVEGIMLDLPDVPKMEEIEWNGEAFVKMKNLRILIIRNACFSTAPTYLPNNLRLLHWENYPSLSFLPPSFHPKKLAILKVPHSHLTLMETPFKKFDALTRMNFSYCDFIKKLPDLSGVPNLQVLDLQSCRNLVEVDNSIGSLGNLERLNFTWCIELTALPQMLKLKNLKEFDLEGCSKLSQFPEILEPMEYLSEIGLSGTAIEELPSSIKYLTTLHTLEVENCRRLEFVPHTIAQMQSLDCLIFEESPLIGNALSRWDESIESCSTSSSFKLSYFNICNNISHLFLHDCNLLDEHLPLISKFFPQLEILSLIKNQFEAVPACFREFQRLEILTLDDCRKLQEFPDILSDMPKLKRISTMNCMALSPQSTELLLKIMVKRLLWPLSIVWDYDRTLLAVPRRRLPELLFAHRSEEETISFYARGNFLPRFLLCICFDMNGNGGGGDVSLWCTMFACINKYEASMIYEYFICEDDNQLWLFDPREYGRFCRRGFAEHIRNIWDCDGWNHVEVGFIFGDVFGQSMPGPMVKEYGIQFKEEESNMDNILFSLPSDLEEPKQSIPILQPEKRCLYVDSISGKEENVAPSLPPKKRRRE